MERAVFGVEQVRGEAAYSGSLGGQKWLTGSSQELSAEMKGRAQLDKFFPPLSGGTEGGFGQRRNRHGVIHIQLRKGRLFVVLVHQPKYSIGRAVPLWLCVRLHVEELDRDTTMLHRVVTDLRDARDRIGEQAKTVVDWCQAEFASERPVDVGIGVSRRMAVLVDTCLARCAVRGSEIPMGPPLDDVPGWQAWQVLLRSISKAWPNGRAFGMAMALEGDAALPKGSDGYSVDVFQLVPPEGAERGEESPGWASRGVTDESLLERLEPRALMESALRHLASKEEAIPASGDWPLHEGLVAAEVPLDLISEALIQPSEVAAWASAVWSRGSRLVEEKLHRIPELGRKGELGRVAVVDLVSQLLTSAASGREPAPDLTGLIRRIRGS